MPKISPKIKFIVGGVLLLGVFVFFMKQTASAFQPRSRGNQRKIGFLGGTRRGRNNRNGTGLRRGKTWREIEHNEIYNAAERD
jgi:hypothetical protein